MLKEIKKVVRKIHTFKIKLIYKAAWTNYTLYIVNSTVLGREGVDGGGGDAGGEGSWQGGVGGRESDPNNIVHSISVSKRS